MTSSFMEKKHDSDETAQQDRRPNFRDGSGKLFLVRCYACESNFGRENWSPAVATGRCAWCGWQEQRDGSSA